MRVEGTLSGGARRAKIDSFLRLWDYEIRNLRPKITPERYFSWLGMNKKIQNFAGQACASGHSTSWPSWLCFGAQRSFSRQTCALSGHTHLCNVQNLVFGLCLGAHRKLARLARERFLDCAPIHSAKMASWSGLARIKTGTRTKWDGGEVKTHKGLVKFHFFQFFCF